MSIFEEIIQLLRADLIDYEVINHEPVFTSEEAARVRGLEKANGAKSLLLKTDSTFVLCILPGNEKLDSSKVKTLFKVKELRFAKPEEVKEIMGCEIGACYPFGNLINLEMIVDKKLADSEYIAFNPGLHNRSIKIKWTDYQKAIDPKLVDISK